MEKKYIFDEILFANFSPVNEDDVVDEHLNEVYSFSLVGGPFSCLEPADVLKEVDPMAYDQFKLDFMHENYVEYEGEYWNSDDFEEAENMFTEQENEEDEDE